MNASVAPTLNPPTTRSAHTSLEQRLVRVEALMHKLALGRRVDRAGAMVTEQLNGGGKRIRARLALEACALFSVPEGPAIAWAAAVELLHNATLIHDDIQDGDVTRRGRPTVWATHGVAQAINAGDLMLMLPFLALDQVGGAHRGDLSALLAQAATLTVRGQVEELGLLDAGHLSQDSYVSACEGKTGALIALPVVGAALLAGRNRKDLSDIFALFVKLGLLFQIQDDVIDLFGDKGRGEVGCDIYEGKVSALLVAHLEAAPETKAQVLEILRKPRELTTALDVESVRALYLQSRAPSLVMEFILQLRDEVLRSPTLARFSELSGICTSLVEMALKPLLSVPTLLTEERAS